MRGVRPGTCQVGGVLGSPGSINLGFRLWRALMDGAFAAKLHARVLDFSKKSREDPHLSILRPVLQPLIRWRLTLSVLDAMKQTSWAAKVRLEGF